MEWPEQYACVQAGGITIFVDNAARAEIESWHRRLVWPDDCYSSITVTSIFDETITIYAGALNSIYDSSPEIRLAARTHEKAVNDERKSQGFLED